MEYVFKNEAILTMCKTNVAKVSDDGELNDILLEYSFLGFFTGIRNIYKVATSDVSKERTNMLATMIKNNKIIIAREVCNYPYSIEVLTKSDLKSDTSILNILKHKEYDIKKDRHIMGVIHLTPMILRVYNLSWFTGVSYYRNIINQILTDDKSGKEIHTDFHKELNRLFKLNKEGRLSFYKTTITDLLKVKEVKDLYSIYNFIDTDLIDIKLLKE